MSQKMIVAKNQLIGKTYQTNFINRYKRLDKLLAWADNEPIENKEDKQMYTNWLATESDNINKGPYVVYRLINGHRDYAEGNFNYLSEAQERADELNEEYGYESDNN